MRCTSSRFPSPARGFVCRSMAVEIRTANGVEVSAPSPLFETGLAPSPQIDQYRVTADGQRFLVLQPAEGESQRLRVIINWQERFKADRPAQ